MTEETKTKMTPEIADALVEDFIEWQIARDAVAKGEATIMQSSFYRSCSTVAGRPAWISRLTTEEALLFQEATKRRAEKLKKDYAPKQ